MHSDDARGSLDNIRRLQERGIDAYVRHMYARPYVFASALMVFIVFASFDLPRPWDTTAVAAGLGIGLLPTLLMRRRAPVLRRLSGPELLLAVGLAAALLVAYVLLQIVAVVATLTLGMPAPHTVAAAAVALLVLAAAGPARRVTAVVVRRATTARNGRAHLMDPDFDEFLHVPARLSIVALLAPAAWVEFAFLRDTIETSDSALSKQLSALADAGYIEIRKSRAPKRRTDVSLIPRGRSAFQRHAAALERIAAAARTDASPPERTASDAPPAT